MSGWPFLIVAAVAAAGAYLAGWPTWSAYRARRERDVNAQRYLAWRGRADRRPVGGLEAGERRRLWIAAALALIALSAVLVALAQP